MSNDDTQPSSGSRWEQPEQQRPAYAPAPQPRHRGRLLLAGGAVGIALVAGTGGFALGHVSAGDERDAPGRFGGPGFQGNFPGQPGQPPDGFGDRHDDGDGDDDGQRLPDDGATQGSAQGSTTHS